MTDQPDELVVLEAPADGVPEVVQTPAGLAEITAALAAGTGPVAIDTERAQGFRYSARAYLIQLRRAGAGTVLLDPIPFATNDAPADLSALAHVLSDAEWILHAATQDLPCLVEVGMVPGRLFDTELAARLSALASDETGRRRLVNRQALAARALGRPEERSRRSASNSPSTLAAPPMSYFISSMAAPGLREMPPVSKVMPLPTITTG